MLSHGRSGSLYLTTKHESAEISTLLGQSILRRPSSIELGWKSFVIERRTTLPCEKPEVRLQNHFLILWDVRVAEGEIAYRDGRFSPYRKYPNTITTRHEFRPTIRSQSKHEVVVGALRTGFVRGIEEELDKPPSGSSPDYMEQTIPTSGTAPSSGEGIGDWRAMRDSVR